MEDKKFNEPLPYAAIVTYLLQVDVNRWQLNSVTVQAGTIIRECEAWKVVMVSPIQPSDDNEVIIPAIDDVKLVIHKADLKRVSKQIMSNGYSFTDNDMTKKVLREKGYLLKPHSSNPNKVVVKLPGDPLADE